ncbi:MAG TPA: carbohydrate ABC transporter permease [Aestuariivirga sp.]|nr:carbohydrate ABC transporter permease [Aestuariivirga sp.]
MRSPLVKILTYALLFFWSLVCLFPLYWIVVTSLKGDPEIMRGPYYLPFVDFSPSLDAWVTVFTYANDHLLLRFFNSAVVAITSTLLTLLFGGLAVYGLTRFRYAVRWMPALNNDGILFAILATRILPPVAVVLPIYVLAQYTGAVDTHFALIFTYTAANLPVAVWLLLPVFGNMATSQEEAAQLDGASHLRIFLTIFLPMVAASIAAVGLIIFILCWNEYLFAAYLTSDKVSTLPAWIMGQMSIKEAQVGGDGDEWPQLSAAMIFMIAPLLACTAFAQRVLGRMALGNR